ncbi:MAG: hypothetical protein H7Y38_17220 [Armatimonadetes bacterium]|nr:hypothetical protein [Armatimonadota bacterium]
MLTLNPLFHKLFALSGITAILAANIDTGELLLNVGDLSDEQAHQTSLTNAKLLRLKISMVACQHHQVLEEMIVSVSNQYHLIYLLPTHQITVRNFLYVILEKETSNLAHARHRIHALMEELSQQKDEVRLLEIETDYLMDTDGIRTKIKSVEDGDPAETEEETPSYLRTEAALRLLGIEPEDIQNAPKYSSFVEECP